jgi:hypothetical protein
MLLFHYHTQNDVPVHTAEILMSNWGLKLQCEHRHALCLSHEHIQAPNTLGLRTSLLRFNEPLPPADSSHRWKAEKNFSKSKEMKGLVEHTCLHLYCGWAVLNTYKKKNLLCTHRPISLFGHHLTLCIKSTRQMPLHRTLLEAQRNFMDPGPHQNCLKI